MQGEKIQCPVCLVLYNTFLLKFKYEKFKSLGTFLSKFQKTLFFKLYNYLIHSPELQNPYIKSTGADISPSRTPRAHHPP